MTSRATFRLIEQDDVWVAAIEGDIDVSNARDLGDEIVETMPNEVLGLVLDLTGLGYLDSSGVALLFSLVRSLETRRQRLVLVVKPDAPLMRLLAVTKLDGVIPVRETPQEAKLLARSAESDSHLA